MVLPFLTISVSELLSQSLEKGSDEFLYAKRLFDEGYFDLAIEQLERYIRDYPDRIDIVEAQFLLGESYLKVDDLDKSRAAFLKIAFVYPESPRAPEALLKVGQVLESAGKMQDAAQAYQRVQAFYPDSPEAPEGLKRGIGLFFNAGDTSQGEAAGEKLIETYPHSESANIARLMIAGITIDRGDNDKAARLLARIIQDSEVDSLAASARFEYARLHRRVWNFNAAEQSYRSIISQFPQTTFSEQARINLADLLNKRGRMSESQALLEPLFTSRDADIQNEAQIKSGDACYLMGDYGKALTHYEKASQRSPEAALKGAWTTQVSGNLQDALERFQRLAKNNSEVSSDARIAAAMIAGNIGKSKEAVELWWDLLDDTTLVDPYGRRYYELAKALFSSEQKGIFEVYKSLSTGCPTSSYLDETLYLAGLESENNEQYQDAIELYNNLSELHVASPYADSAAYRTDYIRICCVKSNQLMERMAELSSRPQDKVKPVRWALDWGDFYLDEFKDPVKAIDKYDTVLDDILATTEDRIHALAMSGEAYARLFQSALLTDEEFVTRMYCDSAYSRLAQLEEIAPQSIQALRLTERLVLIDARHCEDMYGEYPLVPMVKKLIRTFDLKDISPEVIIYLLEYGLTDHADDTLSMSWMNDLAGRMLLYPVADRNYARIQWIRIQSLAESDSIESAISLARDVSTRYRHTPSGAKTAWWLVECPILTPADRLKRLEVYQERYPYLVDPELLGKIKVILLDTLDRLVESINLRDELRSLSRWGVPKLDILMFPDETDQYLQAVAHFKTGMLERSEMEFRTVINLYPNGENAPDALLNLAKIKYRQGKVKAALAYLDTLSINHPYSQAIINSTGFRIQLFTENGEFDRARDICGIAQNESSNQDSIFGYGLQSIRCLYRMGRIEQADQEAKQFLKDQKNNSQVDEAKVRFILEKGYAFDRAKRFEDAHDEYETILKKYTYSTWSDNALYAKGLSLVSMGRFSEGADEIEKVIENYPNSDIRLIATLSLGLARLKAEQYSEAIKALKKLWEDDAAREYWRPAFDALLTAYRDLRYWDAAIQATRDYLQRFPQTTDAMDRRMDIGQFYLQVGEWDEAIRHYRPLLTVADAEQEAEIQYYIGEAFQHKGDYRTAILEYLKVPILGRKTKLDWGVTALYQAGICYEELKENKNAARMYRRIIEATGIESNYGRAAQKRIDGLPGE